MPKRTDISSILIVGALALAGCNNIITINQSCTDSFESSAAILKLENSDKQYPLEWRFRLEFAELDYAIIENFRKRAEKETGHKISVKLQTSTTSRPDDGWWLHVTPNKNLTLNEAKSEIENICKFEEVTSLHNVTLDWNKRRNNAKKN